MFDDDRGYFPSATKVTIFEDLLQRRSTIGNMQTLEVAESGIKYAKSVQSFCQKANLKKSYSV